MISKEVLFTMKKYLALPLALCFFLPLSASAYTPAGTAQNASAVSSHRHIFFMPQRLLAGSWSITLRHFYEKFDFRAADLFLPTG